MRVDPADVACACSAQAEEREQLNADLSAILGGVLPRRLGEMPPQLGLFSRVAPSPEWDALLAKGEAAAVAAAAAKAPKLPRGSG